MMAVPSFNGVSPPTKCRFEEAMEYDKRYRACQHMQRIKLWVIRRIPMVRKSASDGNSRKNATEPPPSSIRVL
jgi:hypothetical protein